MASDDPILEARRVQVKLGRGRARLLAVDRVDLSVYRGRTVGLVGESGSGKSTLARALVGLLKVSGGSVLLDGKDITNARGRSLARMRNRVQIIFQDPGSSLNPRMQVGQAIEEVVAIRARRGQRGNRDRTVELLRQVGLDVALSNRYPHQLSGGQRQRVAVARALAAEPEVLILDEVTSSLDVSVQATVLNLLRRLQSELDLGYLFISHNLSVVRYMSDTIAVMYLGRILEHGNSSEVLAGARHPYTHALVKAIPVLGHRPEAEALGEAPDPRNPPTGCRYHRRCAVGPLVNVDRRICIDRDPSFMTDGSPAPVACHYAKN